MKTTAKTTIDINIYDLCWLAGLIEGEGCFCTKKNWGSPTIVISMTDQDVVEKAAEIMGARVYGPLKTPRLPQYRLVVYGSKAIQWMRILHQFMGNRRRAKIESIMENWNPGRIRERIEIVKRYDNALGVFNKARIIALEELRYL